MKKAYRGLIVAALVGACAGIAQADTWTGAGDGISYSDTNNWSLMTPFPGGTRDINGAFTVTRLVDTTANRTFLKNGAVLNVTGGSHNDGQSGASIYNFIGDTGAGTVNQTDGLYQIGHGVRLGVGGGTGDGQYYLSGGELKIYRGSNSKMEPTNPGGRPSIEIGDSNGGVGLLEVSGGYLHTRAGVHIAQDGVFSVVGSAATGIDLGIDGSGDASWIQNGTLSAAIDGGGVTPIFVDDWDDVGGVVAEIRSGALLDLSFDGIAPANGTWTLLEVENTDILDLGLGLSGTTASGWSFNVDNSGANGLLTATYVIPEPATLGMIAVFGGGILFIRRRFMM